MKPQKQDEVIDKETGTEEELEHDDDEEEDFGFYPLAALRKKPATRQSKKTLSKQIIKSR